MKNKKNFDAAGNSDAGGDAKLNFFFFVGPNKRPLLLSKYLKI